jgi:hypothetical protein
MSDDHRTVSDDSEYDVTFHPAFASECEVLDHRSGAARKLFEQDRTKPVNVRANGHPKKHRIVLRGKNGKRRNITITIDDPDHAIHGITLDLYEEGRDPAREGDWKKSESFSIMNYATTCPPVCEG